MLNVDRKFQSRDRITCWIFILFLRHYTTPQHFNASKLAGLNYTAGETSYQSLQKERPELGLHVNQNHQHQQEQQLQIQVQLQQKQQATSPQQQQQQQHQSLLSPGLNFNNGELSRLFLYFHVTIIQLTLEFLHK